MNHIHLRKVFIMFALLFIMHLSLVALPATVKPETNNEQELISPCNDCPVSIHAYN